MALGWYYDVKAKMWNPSSQVAVERDPFQFVPGPNSYASEYPVHFAFLTTMQNIFEKVGIENSTLNDIIDYLGDYYDLKPTKKDIQSIPQKADEYLSEHPFSKEELVDKRKVPLGAKLKHGFEVHRLRLIWVQQLTGMATDALVFGALYVTLLFPDAVVNDIVPLQYLLIGLLVLSLPLFFGITLIGWYYDKKLRVWSADLAVRAERSPYQYVPPPKAFGIEMPIYFAVFETLIEVFNTIDADTSELERILQYLKDYGCLDVRKDKDIQDARELRKSYGPLFSNQKWS